VGGGTSTASTANAMVNQKETVGGATGVSKSTLLNQSATQGTAANYLGDSVVEPHAMPATHCEICQTKAGETGAYRLTTWLGNEFQKCQLCCMLLLISLCFPFSLI
jgi:hypothetical protein